MRVEVPATILAPHDLGSVHLIGIGGAGLSAIARVLLGLGVPVSGSDGSQSPTLEALRDLGATVYVGHDAANLGSADTVVVSVAIPEDNPEVVAARAAGIRIYPRSAAMASILSGHRAIAVAGTHGKTTTTSLLTCALLGAGADPTYTIGGDLAASGRNAAVGAGDLFVAEADESDGAFLVYSPFGAIVTGVEADHLDQWGTEEAYAAAFDQFVTGVSDFVVAITDDPGAAALRAPAEAAGVEFISVGLQPGADLRAVDVEVAGGRSRFVVVRDGIRLGVVTLQIPGRHYVADALAAVACGLRLGFAFDDLRRGLESYTGTRRRMEFKGEAGSVRVYDSYAHHPSEISGDLDAGRSLVSDGRLVVAFQPHLVSRTRAFGARMGQALSAADEVVVLDIYLAREAPDPAVTSDLISAAVSLPGDRVHRVAGLADASDALAALVRAGDVVLTLGAGSITDVGPMLLETLDG